MHKIKVLAHSREGIWLKMLGFWWAEGIKSIREIDDGGREQGHSVGDYMATHENCRQE